MDWNIFKKNKIIEVKPKVTSTIEGHSNKGNSSIKFDKTLKVEDYQKYSDNYSENNLKEKIRSVSKSLGAPVVEKVLFLYYLLTDDNSPVKGNPKLIALIIGVLGYFIMPIDAIPDYILGAGYVDDIAALSSVIATVIATINKSNPNNIISRLNERAKMESSKFFLNK